MIEEERSPALRRRAPASGHVLGYRGLAYVDAELEEFSMYEERPRKDLPSSSRGSAAELREAPWACRVVVETSSARRGGIQHDAIVRSSQAARLSPHQERSARPEPEIKR